MPSDLAYNDSNVRANQQRVAPIYDETVDIKYFSLTSYRIIWQHKLHAKRFKAIKIEKILLGIHHMLSLR